jgi:hypothetical protein
MGRRGRVGGGSGPHYQRHLARVGPIVGGLAAWSGNRRGALPGAGGAGGAPHVHVCRRAGLVTYISKQARGGLIVSYPGVWVSPAFVTSASAEASRATNATPLTLGP